LFVVHAYRTLVSADHYWPQLVRANDARRGDAQHVVASAVQLARARCPRLCADGSSIAGPVSVVLDDVSHVAELLVVGRRAGSPAPDVRQLASGSACPVVFVGAQPRDEGPVVVLLDRDAVADGFSAAVDFGFAAAAQRGAGLLVVQSELPDFSRGPAALAAQTERQEQLDIVLDDWRERFPSVGVAVELRREPIADSANRLLAAAQLLVLAGGSRDLCTSLECAPHEAAIVVLPPTTHRSSPCSTSHLDNRAASLPLLLATRTSSAANGSPRQRAGIGST
jgi:hypothetical protein